MKKLITICLLVVLMAVLAPTAKAVAENPAEWSFSLETYEGDVSWISSTNVITGYPQYEYSWQLDYADLQVFGSWYSILGYVDVDEYSGSGTESGLPFIVLDDDLGEEGAFTAHVLAGVDEDGYGYANMTNVVFGSFEGYGVTGFRCGGDATVTGVPEPATICLLGLGALSLISRKKRT